MFVYGTLKRGQANHGVISEFVESATAATVEGFTLYAGPSWPGARPAPGGRVCGELLVLRKPAAALRLLDDLEEVPHVYRRRSIRARCEDGGIEQAWIYVLTDPPPASWSPCGERWPAKP